MKVRKNKKLYLFSLSVLTLGTIVYTSHNLLDISASTFETQESSELQTSSWENEVFADIQVGEENAEMFVYQGFSDNILNNRIFVATVRDELGNWAFISPNDSLENERFNEVTLFQTDAQGRLNVEKNLMEKLENGAYNQFQLFELSTDLLADDSTIKKVDLAQEIGLDTIHYLENQESEDLFGVEEQQIFLNKMNKKWQTEEMTLQETGVPLLTGNIYMLLQESDAKEQEDITTIETENSSDLEMDSSYVEKEEIVQTTPDSNAVITEETSVETIQTEEESTEITEETTENVVQVEDTIEDETDILSDSSTIIPIPTSQIVNDPFNETKESYQLVVEMESPSYLQNAPEPTTSELSRWVKSAQIVEKSTQNLVEFVTDYSVKLVSPTVVDMNRVGTTGYDVEVSVSYENSTYIARQTVEVTVVADSNADSAVETPIPEPTSASTSTPVPEPEPTPESTPEPTSTSVPEPASTPVPAPTSTQEKTMTQFPQLNEQASWVLVAIGFVIVGFSILGFRKRKSFDK